MAVAVCGAENILTPSAPSRSHHIDASGDGQCNLSRYVVIENCERPSLHCLGSSGDV